MTTLVPSPVDVAPSLDERNAVFAERMDYANLHARPSMWLALPASLVTCAVLYDHVPATHLVGWLAAVILTYVVRAAGVLVYQRRAKGANDRARRRWAWITAGLAIPTGVAWSLLPLWAAAPASDLGMVAIVVIIAVAAVAMRGLSPLWGIYAAFVLSMLAPVALASIAAGGGAARALGIAMSIYAVSILLVARRADAEFGRRALLELRMRSLLGRLDAARSAAEVANAAKSQFIANVSHEVRTPLQGVLGLTELLLGSALDATQRGYAEIIERSGRGLLRILNDLLDLSKVEAGKLVLERAPMEIRAVVTEVVELYSAGATTKSLALSAAVADDVPGWVFGDALRLAEILGNLVSNAMKFTERGGVQVRVEVALGDKIRFTVKDTGIGLSRDQQQRVFDAFTQADSTTTRRYGGTGLGLAIVKHLVELYEGTLGVDSELGAGAEFWCELPLTRAPDRATAGAAAAGPQPDTPPPAPQPHEAPALGEVLIVEDNEVNRVVIRAVLDSLGVPYRVAVDGVEALEAFAARVPALIVMDSQMPRLGGCDTTIEIRRIEADRGLGRTPIVALTAGAASGDREACLAAGMDDFLTKPFSVVALRECVRRWLTPHP